MDIPVLYEDADTLVVDKPSGLVVHPDGRTDEPTLADWISKTHPGIVGVGEPLTLADGTHINRPGIVHRLDRETSGALIIAKNQESFLRLKEQFQTRRVAKTYHAFVHGELKESTGTIERHIGRSAGDFRKWSAQRGARGQLREAVTEYAAIARARGFSFVEVRPKTGRTHQIRVHMKAINHPVVCDSLYGGKLGCALGFARLALHASKVEWENARGERVAVESPLPEDFIRARAALES